MHNIDRTQPETWQRYEYGPTAFGYEAGGPGGYGEYGGETGGYGEYGGETGGYGEYGGETGGYGEYGGETGGYGEYGGYGEMEMESPLGEEMEMALTAELLEINNEQ